MVGDVGGAILFFISMIGMIIVGLYTFAYTAHIVLAVIESTAGGADEVAWPSEPYVDWIVKFLYLFWLVTVWLVPLGLVSQWLLRTRSVAAALPGILATAAVLFWLLFPMSLLSSLSAGSRWVIFSPALLPRLAQRSGSVMAFYLLTAPVLAAGAAMAYGLFFLGSLGTAAAGEIVGRPFISGILATVLFGSIGTAILPSLGLAAVILIYSRLFGRMALHLRSTWDRQPRSRAPKRPPMTQVQAAARVARSAPRGQVIRAADLPPVNAPDEDARIGYDMRLVDLPSPEPAAAMPRRPVYPDDGQYALADDAPTDEPLEPRLPARLLNPSEYELRLAGRGRTIRPPEHPWSSGVWGFPFAAANRFKLLGIALGFAVMGTLYRLMVSYTPG